MRALIAGLVLVLGITLVVTTGACGGGGGGGGPGTPTGPAALFTGPFFYQAVAGAVGPPVDGWAWWGSMTGNGAGMVTAGNLEWDHGGTQGSTPFTPFPYTIDAAGHATWGAGTALELQGGFAADGTAACLASVANGSFPGLALLCRRAGSFNLASLNGTYHLLAYVWGGGLWDFTYWGTVAFDGSGGATTDVTENRSGTINPIAPYVGAYSVLGDGTVDFDFRGFVDARGGILFGGDLVVLSGGQTVTNPPFIAILIRQASSATEATLNGTYHTVSILADNGGTPHYTSWTGTMTADGAGSMSRDIGGTRNRDGTVGTYPSLAIFRPYTVAADGTLTIGTGGLVGAVSPTGAYAAFAGGTGGGSVPEFWVLMR